MDLKVAADDYNVRYPNGPHVRVTNRIAEYLIKEGMGLSNLISKVMKLQNLLNYTL